MNPLFVTFKQDYTSSPEHFVSYWKQHFEYPNMNWYSDNINVPQLGNDNLYELFCWKNGMTLSGKKKQTFQKISQHLPVINGLRSHFIEETFTAHFHWMTPVWKIFLRHIIQPKEAPIFDQHVYRAYRHIHKQEKVETAASRLEDFYNQEYVPFFKNMEKACPQCTAKEVDNALWSFGKFLSLYPKLIS